MHSREFASAGFAAPNAVSVLPDHLPWNALGEGVSWAKALASRVERRVILENLFKGVERRERVERT
jgi:hypothetical protein